MITDMLVGHPWIGRILGYGEIDLLTASEAGTNKIRFLPDADGFKRMLLDARHEYELDVGGGHPLQDSLAAVTARVPAAAPPPRRCGRTAAAEEIDTSISRLDDMRKRGLITASGVRGEEAGDPRSALAIETASVPGRARRRGPSPVHGVTAESSCSRAS